MVDPIGQTDQVYRAVAERIEGLVMRLIIELRNPPRYATTMRQSHIAIIGAPMDLGAGRRGVDMGPRRCALPD